MQTDFPVDEYYSTGETGDKVNVTIHDGKVSASFSNITVEGFATSETVTVSGIVIQNK
ncbi:MAG TPA: hypothetical protein VII44_00125 [Puia sp.]